MKNQILSSGKWYVEHGEPMEYQSPLSIVENWPSIVIYADSKTKHQVGVVYKAGDDRWYLSSVYLKNWNPIEVFAKYAGFLFLRALHSKRNG